METETDYVKDLGSIVEVRAAISADTGVKKGP